VMTGIKTESLRKQFDVSSSTFSRWMTGFSSPTQSLRTRLGSELLKLTDESKERVPVLDAPPAESTK